MHAQPEIKKRTIHRLKIAKGHLSKIISMVEGDTYCMDIIHQSQAVQKALKEIDALVLENHLQSCVVQQIQEGQAQTAISEVMNVFKKRK